MSSTEASSDGKAHAQPAPAKPNPTSSSVRGRPAERLRVCVIAAHPRSCRRLAGTLSKATTLDLAGVFLDIEAAQPELTRDTTHAALVEVDGAGRSTERIRKVRFFAPRLAVAAWAAHWPPSLIFSSLAAGAAACIAEQAPPDQLAHAISAAAGGQLFLCKQVHWQALNRLRILGGAPHRRALTPREELICLWLCHGREKDAARALNLSAQTVHTHSKSIYRKLAVHGRRELLKLLTQQG